MTDFASTGRLVPSKAEVTLLKLSNRSQAYTCNSSTPLFFDPEGRGDVLVPTVYALWQFPQMLPALQTYSEVSPKVRCARACLDAAVVPLQPRLTVCKAQADWLLAAA